MTRLEQLQQIGIRRRGSLKQGFHYEPTDKRKITSDDLSRIKALRIPPAWIDVFINPSPRSSPTKRARYGWSLRSFIERV
jgi:DNA topoisomerase I